MTEVTVTIKGGTAYDAPWIVYRGDPGEIRGELAVIAQVADQPDLDLAEVTVQAARRFVGVYSVASTLGASTIPNTPRNQRKTGGSEQRSTPAAEPEKKPTVQVGEVLAEIEAATSHRELKQIWADRSDVFSGDDKTAIKQALKTKTDKIGENK